MLTLAGQLIKSSVGTCGVLLLLFEVLSPLLSVVAMALLLKGVAALIQPLGEGGIATMFTNISNDLEYFIAGLLLVAFLYFMLVMGILHSVNYFI
jgi:stage III sporulation protein AE